MPKSKSLCIAESTAFAFAYSFLLPLPLSISLCPLYLSPPIHWVELSACFALLLRWLHANNGVFLWMRVDKITVRPEHMCLRVVALTQQSNELVRNYFESFMASKTTFLLNHYKQLVSTEIHCELVCSQTSYKSTHRELVCFLNQKKFFFK